MRSSHARVLIVQQVVTLLRVVSGGHRLTGMRLP